MSTYNEDLLVNTLVEFFFKRNINTLNVSDWLRERHAENRVTRKVLNRYMLLHDAAECNKKEYEHFITPAFIVDLLEGYCRDSNDIIQTCVIYDRLFNDQSVLLQKLLENYYILNYQFRNLKKGDEIEPRLRSEALSKFRESLVVI